MHLQWVCLRTVLLHVHMVVNIYFHKRCRTVSNVPSVHNDDENTTTLTIEEEHGSEQGDDIVTITTDDHVCTYTGIK